MPEHSGPPWKSNETLPWGPPGAKGWAFLLDVDGTLLELAATPEAVRPAPGLVNWLARLETLAGGGMALVSGRPLRDLDRLFAPQRFLAAGVHGAELRLAEGVERRVAIDTATLDRVRHAFGAFALDHPGTLVEDKDVAVTLHYRRRPDAADAAHRLALQLGERLGRDFHVLEGKMVVEIRPTAATKGVAVDAFLGCPAFAGRRPVYVGDDVTDEDAFRAVNDAGGVSVVVGSREPTVATQRLADVSAVHRWLRDVIAHLEATEGHA